jgi:hypothetical protein
MVRLPGLTFDIDHEVHSLCDFSFGIGKRRLSVATHHDIPELTPLPGKVDMIFEIST